MGLGGTPGHTACGRLGSRKQSLLDGGSAHSGAPRPPLTLPGRRPGDRCSALHSPPGDGGGVPCALRSAAFCSSGRATRRRTGPGNCHWSAPGTQAPAGARRGWGRCTSPETAGPHRDQPAAPALLGGPCPPPGPGLRGPHEFPVAAATDCHTFVAQSNTNVLSQSLEVRSLTGRTGPTSRCRQGRFPLEAAGETLFPLYFPASRGHLHPGLRALMVD